MNTVKQTHATTSGTEPHPVAPPSYPQTSDAYRDRVLVARIKGGDQSAFEEIVALYQPRIYSLAHRRLGNHQDAEEVTQDAFLRALRGLVGFRGDSAFSTWLYQIAVNLSQNRYWYWWRRKRHQMVSFDAPLEVDGKIALSEVIPAGDDAPDDEASTQDLRERIATAMERLSTNHREILKLRNVDNMSYDEIAKILRISMGTVKSRIARAREELRSLSLAAPSKSD